METIKFLIQGFKVICRNTRQVILLGKQKKNHCIFSHSFIILLLKFSSIIDLESTIEKGLSQKLNFKC